MNENKLASTQGVEQAIDERYQQYFNENACRTDRLFAILMIFQMCAGVAGALWLTPRTWSGSSSSIHIHVWASLGIGVLIAAAPLYLIYTQSGSALTRYTVAVAQMLFSTLIIHICAGRIEAHFHIFGSLAFLAFYRDWRLFIPATFIILADHLVRGMYWPESIFGVLAASQWRAFEHAGWVVFENTFLIYSCIMSTRQMRTIATSQVELEHTNQGIEATVKERTEELRVANESLLISDERYRLVVEGTREAVWDWNLSTGHVYYAANWRAMFGIAPDAPMSNTTSEWFGRITSNSLQYFQTHLNRYLIGETHELDLEVEMRHSDGQLRWMLCRAAASRNETGKAIRLAGSLTDITDLRDAQDKLRRLAEFDQLTDLPNRDYLHQQLDFTLEQGNASEQTALAFFDFDRFKVVNDSLGHSAGDSLLKSIADRFRKMLRQGDVVARFGGDEFVLMLRNVTNEKHVKTICERLLSTFAEPHEIDGHRIVSTASIGVVINTNAGRDADDMIRDADAAMYRAKSQGRNRFQIFDEQMRNQAVSRLNLEHELRQAIESDQLEVYYQPIVSNTDAKIKGFEALMRWQHPEHGLVRPADFVPIAEETGLIIDMGKWVLRRACQQLRMWNEQHACDEKLTVAVNLSRCQVIHPTIISDVKQILEETGVPPQAVCLEITETMIMDPRHDMTQVIRDLKGLGVKIALDDFGTGHSSLSCLHTFPIDILKIDRSFIKNLGERMAFIAVLDSIISLGHHLDMHVVGEGIETKAQLAQLQALECDYAQGYLFAAPSPPQEIDQLLSQGMVWRGAA